MPWIKEQPRRGLSAVQVLVFWRSSSIDSIPSKCTAILTLSVSSSSASALWKRAIEAVDLTLTHWVTEEAFKHVAENGEDKAKAEWELRRALWELSATRFLGGEKASQLDGSKCMFHPSSAKRKEAFLFHFPLSKTGRGRAEAATFSNGWLREKAMRATRKRHL